ncbi:hypothetical protein JW964_09550 [candidate division KSB1 bacterium]|nr:hypothetical protein [candidate division KSB1 bacterium]
MRNYPRKSTPKVKGGKVQKKNNWVLTPNYYNTRQPYPVFDKERPGSGYTHLIKRKDLYDFIDLIPEWDELAKGLDAVVLAAGDDEALGWHIPGVVGICAWDEKIEWIAVPSDYYEEHKSIFEKLKVECHRTGDDWDILFTENSAKAFQLIHVFLHELGHHHDRMTTKSKRRTGRGEKYAEAYAIKYEDVIIKRYFDKFKW